jgi:pimeloyl-ACP methyl ester carboxylesterase
VRADLRRPDGTTIAYDVAGDGPPVVFIHGITNSRHGWDRVTPLLHGEFTCVRPDLRGHGESSKASDYGMLALVADVHAVAEELGLEAPAVVGHSLGATVAALYAAVHDPRAIVTVDQSLRFGDFARFLRPYADRLATDECGEALLDVERELGITTHPDGPAAEERIRTFPPDVIRGLWATLLTTPPDELTALAEQGLPQISAPLLALHGSPPPPDYEAWLTQLVPTAQVELWDGAGHFLHVTQPERFAERLRGL